MPKPKPDLAALLEESDHLIEKHAKARAEADRELHQKWVNGGKQPEDLEPLLRRYESFIHNKSQQLQAPMVNPTATRLHVQQAVVKAFDTYNPERGAALNTHVQNVAKGVLRKVIKVQDLARIPEADALHIGRIQAATARLQDELGTAPTLGQLATETNLSQKVIKRVRERQVHDLSSGGFEVPVAAAVPSREREVIPFIRARLTPKEQKVFDLVYHPINPVLGTNDIAKKTGLSAPDISDIKSRIAGHIKSAL